MKFRSLTALIAVSAALTACGPSTDSTTSPSLSAGFQAKFEPASGVLPFPNDLYSGTNGQLNIPGNTAVSQNGPLLEQNHLDGFGTQSDISVYFTSSIDKSSINSSDVIMFKVASDIAKKKAVDPTGTITKLKMGTDFIAEVSPGTDSGGSILTIKPLHPLAASSIDPTTQKPVPATYLVVVTNSLKDTSGDAATASPDYSKILAADLPVLSGGKMGSTGDATLDQVAEFTLPQLAVAAAEKVDPTTIAITFSFSTEYLGVALGEIEATAAATTQPSGTGEMVDTGEDVCTVLVSAKQVANAAACPTGATNADLFVGGVTLPYYLTAPSKSNPTAALTDSWHNSKGGDIALNSTDATSFMPVATSQQNIPIIASIPNTASGCTMPPSGWPVVIFQHGITRNREDMLGIAGTFAQLCFAVVAIDLPLHGVTDKTDPLYENQLFKGTPAAAILTVPVTERTFNMDLENNTTLAAGSDGKIDSSGAWFINLTNTITSRDNLREGAADLVNLTVTLPHIAGVTPPATVNTFDPANVFFVGHSLGGIEGTTFLGVDAAAPRIKAATLAMPGGHIAELLRNSAEFEPIIDAGLAQQGLVKGTQEYYDFYSQAQAVVEDGDPANYAFNANATHPIHMIEVVGSSTNLPDQVVPNSATQVLIDVMGLTKVTATDINPAGVHGVVQFTVGDHGSILSPAAPSGSSATIQAQYLAATTEMQTEALIFAAGFPVGPIPGDGEAIVINDNTVVKH